MERCFYFSMRKAEFIGKNDSKDLKNGKIYNVILFYDKRNNCDCIETLPEKISCHYNSVIEMAKDWKFLD